MSYIGFLVQHIYETHEYIIRHFVEYISEALLISKEVMTQEIIKAGKRLECLMNPTQ